MHLEKVKVFELRYQRHLENVRRWYKTNRDKKLAQNRRWQKSHPEKMRAYWRAFGKRHRQRLSQNHARREKLRRKLDPVFAMISRMRGRIKDAVRGRTTKSKKTLALLGCTPRQFKQHLESLFLPGMSWANRNLWHIDHKRPISSFDLTTEAGQRAAFHYMNCQPLWALDNFRKGAKI